MSSTLPIRFVVNSKALVAECVLVGWDQAAFGFPVAQIERLQIRDPETAGRDFERVAAWLDQQGVKLASCRLAHDQLSESMLLETNGFRFVEMVISPKLDGVDKLAGCADSIAIEPAGASDVPALQAIAQSAFGHERYHVDPRLNRQLADKRYGNWVANTLTHSSQKLLKITDANRLVGVFIAERFPGGHAYWHLTAIAPEWQGMGYGRRVWTAMLNRHSAEGCVSLTTNVSVRNVAVLNLYARLGFRFLPPQMTFHWLRSGG